MIGNSNITKIGSREVFEHFHEHGSAVDCSSRCIHNIKRFLVLSQVDMMNMQKIRFLLIGSDRASKKHENGRDGEF